MNGSQLMGLDSMGTEIHAIHGYYRELMIGQQSLGLWGVIAWYQSMGMQLPRA